MEHNKDNIVNIEAIAIASTKIPEVTGSVKPKNEKDFVKANTIKQVPLNDSKNTGS